MEYLSAPELREATLFRRDKPWCGSISKCTAPEALIAVLQRADSCLNAGLEGDASEPQGRWPSRTYASQPSLCPWPPLPHPRTRSARQAGHHLHECSSGRVLRRGLLARQELAQIANSVGEARKLDVLDRKDRGQQNSRPSPDEPTSSSRLVRREGLGDGRSRKS